MHPLLRIGAPCYLLLLGLLAIPATAQTAAVDTLWYETFDSNWFLRWTVESGTWEVGLPTSGPEGCHEGDFCAATVLAGNYPESVDTRLIRTNSFTVPAASENPRLRFWHWFSFGASDDGEVQIKTAGGDWETISPSYTSTASGVWSNASIDLSAWASSEVQIAFDLHTVFTGCCGSASSGWYIDEVQLLCDGGVPCAIPLPVELAAFEASTDGADVSDLGLLDVVTGEVHPQIRSTG